MRSFEGERNAFLDQNVSVKISITHSKSEATKFTRNLATVGLTTLGLSNYARHWRHLYRV